MTAKTQISLQQFVVNMPKQNHYQASLTICTASSHILHRSKNQLIPNRYLHGSAERSFVTSLCINIPWEGKTAMSSLQNTESCSEQSLDHTTMFNTSVRTEFFVLCLCFLIMLSLLQMIHHCIPTQNIGKPFSNFFCDYGWAVFEELHETEFSLEPQTAHSWCLAKIAVLVLSSIPLFVF